MPVTRSVSIEELASMFCLPEKICARQLGVCLTSLKKICRSHGISRWPYRKLKSIDKKLGKIENAMNNTATSTEDPAAMKYKLELLKLERQNLPYTATNGALAAASCSLPSSFMGIGSSSSSSVSRNSSRKNGEHTAMRKRTSPVANAGAASSVSSSPSSPLSTSTTVRSSTGSSSSHSHYHTSEGLSPDMDSTAAYHTFAAGVKRNRPDSHHHSSSGLPAPTNSKMMRKDQSPSASSACSTASTATLPHPGVVGRSLSSSSLSSSISGASGLAHLPHHAHRGEEDEEEDGEEEDDVSLDDDEENDDDDEDYELVSAKRAQRVRLNSHTSTSDNNGNAEGMKDASAAASSSSANNNNNNSSNTATTTTTTTSNSSASTEEGTRPPTPRCEPPRAARHYRPAELELCESLALPLPSETCGGRPNVAAALNTEDDSLLMSAPPRNRREDASLLADYYCRPDSARFLSARGNGHLLEGLPLISPSNAAGNGRETVMDELFPPYSEPLSTASKADFFTSEEPDFFLLH